MGMGIVILNDYDLRQLEPENCFTECEKVIKADTDESKRWDAVWIVGELGNKDYGIEMFDKVTRLMIWVLENDDNGVVKHEACYQIAARNMRNAIPALINSFLNDTSVLTKHEAIESLGLMRAFEAENSIKKALDDPSKDVRETATFVIKRIARLRKSGEYVPSAIL